MEVDPTAEELQQAQASKSSTHAVSTATTTTSATVMAGTTTRRFVLKRRLQNGASASPSNSNGANGGEANSTNSQLVPQLISTASSLSNNTPSAGSALLAKGVASVGTGSLKIRKIEQ